MYKEAKHDCLNEIADNKQRKKKEQQEETDLFLTEREKAYAEVSKMIKKGELKLRDFGQINNQNKFKIHLCVLVVVYSKAMNEKHGDFFSKYYKVNSRNLAKHVRETFGIEAKHSVRVNYDSGESITRRGFNFPANYM